MTTPARPTPPPADTPVVRLPLSAWEDRLYAAQAIDDPRLRAREALALAAAMLERLREMRP